MDFSLLTIALLASLLLHPQGSLNQPVWRIVESANSTTPIPSNYSLVWSNELNTIDLFDLTLIIGNTYFESNSDFPFVALVRSR